MDIDGNASFNMSNGSELDANADHDHVRFHAAYMFGMLVVVLLWRGLGRRKAPKRIKLWVQVSEYGMLYSFFLWLMMDAVRRALEHLPQIAALDHEILETTIANSTTNVTLVVQQVRLDHFPALRWASVCSPIPVLLAWFVSLLDTFRHVRVMWYNTDLSETSVRAHDRAVQIIALPAVFALMSLSGVARIWDVMRDSFSDDVDGMDTWEERRMMAFQFYDAHYHIADLYEAWSLMHFGKLALEVLAARFRRTTIQEEGADPFDDDVDHHGGLVKLATRMNATVQTLTMQGIWSFVVVCGAESLYGVANPVIILFLHRLGLHSYGFVSPVLKAMEESQAEIHNVFIGMGFVASCAAITNIVQVEHALRDELKDFRPFWKFLGTKVLVSFAFIQQIMVMLPVPPFRQMTTSQSKLFYSTLLCYECFAVSILHMYAWAPDEAWYDDEGKLHVSSAGASRDSPPSPTCIGRHGAWESDGGL